MKNNNLFSYQPENPNQKIWQVYPDPKSNFIALEIKTKQQKQEQKNASQIVILDTQKKEIFAIAEIEDTQMLVNFFNKIILLSEIDFQNQMPLPKGLKALNIDFETIWEIEEVNYYGVIEEDKVVFSFQSNYYSLPLKFDDEELETKEEKYSNLKSKVNKYLYPTKQYLTNHINHKDISRFVFEKTNHKTESCILYTENNNYLLCSYLVENQDKEFDNYLLCTDKKGSLKNNFLIKKIENTKIKIPQELILMENNILWINENEFHFLK